MDPEERVKRWDEGGGRKVLRTYDCKALAGHKIL